MIRVSCVCGGRFQTQDVNAGKRAKCPQCGNVLVLPAPEGQAKPAGSQSGAKPAESQSGSGPPPAWWFPKETSRSGEIPPAGAPKSGTAERPVAPAPAAPGSLRGRWASLPPKQRTGALVVAGAAALLMLGLIAWLRSGGLPPGPPGGDDGRPPDSIPTTSKAPPPPTGTGTPTTPGPGEAVVGKRGPTRLRLLVPAYFFPAGPGLKDWDRLIEAAGRVDVVAIANPSTGPGTGRDPGYDEIITRATRRNVVVVGYVNTDYAKRPRDEVEADVDRWAEFYPTIRGIFFDLQATGGNHAGYYAGLRKHAQEQIKGALVVTNPGTICAEDFLKLPASDLVCIFSNQTSFKDFEPPRWVGDYDPRSIAAMPYAVPDPERMRECVRQAISKGIHSLYVTDGELPNAWDRLPAYWDDEVEAVERANRPAP